MADLTTTSAVDTFMAAANQAAMKTAIGLGSVENTAISTWAGSTNITTVGTITTGTWSGSFGAVSGENLTTLNASNISSGTLAAARFPTCAITSGTLAGITGFGLRDTVAAHDLTIQATGTGMNESRTLTLNCGNVAHTLAFGTTANTITFPNVASFTVAGLSVANVFTAAQTLSVNGTSTVPAFLASGSIATGSNAKPLFLLEPAGTTSSGWSANGTLFGINAPTGSTTRLFDVQQNGVSKLYFEGGNLIHPIPGSNLGFRMGITGNWSWVFLGAEGVGIRNDLFQGWASGSDPTNTSTLDTRLYRGGVGVLAQRHGSTPQIKHVYGLYSDSSNYIRLAFNTTNTTLGIACETLGSGEDNIDLSLTPAGTGNVRFPGGVLLKTAAALTDGAAAAIGTLTNAPSAGNPTKWVPINDNGTTRYMPLW